MIPKIIHYCWLGNNPKSKLIEKCIASWREKLPDYKIVEWSESNFDINNHAFMSEAYKIGKFAFSSDQLRYLVLSKYGGIFLDCDVGVLRSMDSLLDNELFLGLEEHVGNKFVVNPGLVIGCEPNNWLINKMVAKYESCRFLDEFNNPNMSLSSPFLLTTELLKYGYQNNNVEQDLEGKIKIYPTSFFDPIDHKSFRQNLKGNWREAYTIHWGAGSWLGRNAKYRRYFSLIVRKIFGNRIIDIIRRK